MKVVKLNGKLTASTRGLVGANVQEKTVTPTSERQEITADEGYACLSKVIVEGVTSAVDSNIVPENIKKDVSILGVVGTLESIPVPTKSWLFITEYDSNGYPIKAKTIGCSGDMPYGYMYGCNNTDYNVLSRYLRELEINEGVTNIGYSAFQYCIRLKSITIPNSVTSIGSYAFYNCTSLKSITIPNSVTSIGSYAFYWCTNLPSINIPDSITSIGSSTFYKCQSLPSIVMPSALTRIDSKAFYNCSNCKLFDFRKVTQVPTLADTNAFYDTPSTKKIVVPDSLYDSWITATNWSSSTNNIVSSIIKASDYESTL